MLLVVRSAGLPVSVCQGAALSGRAGAAAPAFGGISPAPACAQKGGAEMIHVRTKFSVEVCGAVRAAGRCPSLCRSEGGCFCSEVPPEGGAINIAEMKRRSHRSRRVLNKVYIIEQGGEL